MEYTVSKLSKMSGISTRTLRYYDQIGLLKPARVSSSGYRIYEQGEVDKLQQILFFRELGFSLESIKNLLTAQDFDRANTLENHLASLRDKRNHLDTLIQNVTRSIADMKGEINMTDEEKFQGFKKNLVSKNEQEYGKEIRERYGDKVIDDSNELVINMSKQQYDEGEMLRIQLEKTLKLAYDTGDYKGKLAQEACELHKRWLCYYNQQYSREYHMALGEMYLSDERFKENYEKIAVGCTEFFRDAITYYCKD